MLYEVITVATRPEKQSAREAIPTPSAAPRGDDSDLFDDEDEPTVAEQRPGRADDFADEATEIHEDPPHDPVPLRGSGLH